METENPNPKLNPELLEAIKESERLLLEAKKETDEVSRLQGQLSYYSPNISSNKYKTIEEQDKTEKSIYNKISDLIDSVNRLRSKAVKVWEDAIIKQEDISDVKFEKWGEDGFSGDYFVTRGDKKEVYHLRPLKNFKSYKDYFL